MNLEANKLAEWIYGSNENPPYYIKRGKVFFFSFEIKSADIDSFLYYNNGFAKDKNKCYCSSKLLKGGNPKSFKIYNYAYVGDDKHIWSYGGEIKEADVETFTVCDKGFVSGNMGAEKTYYPTGYAKDKNNVYFYDFFGKNKILINADSGSFISFSIYNGRDKNNVFIGKSLVKGANPDTWTAISSPFYRDKKNVYCNTKKIIGADINTFEVLMPNDDFQKLAKDKNNFYCYEKKISEEEFNKEVALISKSKSQVDNIK